MKCVAPTVRIYSEIIINYWTHAAYANSSSFPFLMSIVTPLSEQVLNIPYMCRPNRLEYSLKYSAISDFLGI